jgi:hypothetical protein
VEGGRAAGKGGYLSILAQVGLQVCFKTINMWAERGYPVGVKGLLYKPGLGTAHVWGGEPYFLFI